MRRLQHFTRSGVFREEPKWILPRQAVEEVIASVMPTWEARGQDRECPTRVVTDYSPSRSFGYPCLPSPRCSRTCSSIAFEAMPAGGQVRIRVRADLRHVLFSVSDDGEGIPPALRPRIFDPFFTTKPAPSSGLRTEYLPAHHADPRGNRHRRLRSRARQHVHGAAAAAPGSAGGACRGARLLGGCRSPPASSSSTTEPLVVETLAGLLQQAGHSVETALTGSTGIERYRQRRFDCVVTDLLMPGLNGLTVGRAIKDQDPGAYVVLLTAQAEQLDAKQTEAAGVDRVFYQARRSGAAPFDIRDRGTDGPRTSHGDRMSKTLIIDDNRELAKILSAELTRRGHFVHCAHSGKEGLALLDRVVPDLIFLDLRLPDMKGTDVLAPRAGRAVRRPRW